MDLFAGTGALGIEALSRGAASAVFVDRASGPIAVLRGNLETLGLQTVGRVQKADAAAAVGRLGREGRSFGLILMDPPYADPCVEEVMRGVAEAGILTRTGLLVVESAVRSPPAAVAGLAVLDERRYGDTLVLRYTRGGDETGGGP